MAARPKDEWYYHKGDVTHGPLPFKGLRRLASSGALATDDKVWLAEREEWVAASAVPQLFVRKKKAAVRADAAGHPQPVPGATIPVRFWQILWVLVAILGVVAWYAGKEAGFKTGERKGYERGKAEGQALGSSEGFQRGVEYAAKLAPPHDAKEGREPQKH